MISVVTVVKEDPEGLERTRRSLEGQTFKAWTHIVVPAMDTDLSSKLAKSWNGSKTVVRDQVGAGIYSAMNQGLASVTDGYVVFLNAGDLFANDDALGLVAECLLGSDPNWAAFGGFVHRDAETISVSPIGNPSAWLIGCGRAQMLHPSVYYKKDFLNRLGGYDETFRIAGDLDLHIKLAQEEPPMVFSGQVSIFFANGISSTQVFYTILESFRSRSIRFRNGLGVQILSALWMLNQLVRAATKILMTKATGFLRK